MEKLRDLEIAVNGYRFSVIEYGDPEGLPVLALHGWLDNAGSFLPLQPHLKGVRLIAVDLAGHGFSSYRPAGMPYHIWDNAVDMLALLDALQLDRVALLGHSMGASIAMLVAALSPQRISHLGLVEGLAPLVYPVGELPQLMAQAIYKRNKMRRRPVKCFTDWEQVVKSRVEGRWPVSREVAELLLQRGVRQTGEGWCWTHDPELLQPSLVRFSEAQVAAFIGQVQAPGFVLVATDFARETLVGPWRNHLKTLKVENLPGSHHLHMQPQGAVEVADRINLWAMEGRK